MRGPTHQMHGLGGSWSSCLESLDWGWWGPEAYLILPGPVPQKDLLLFGDGRRPVVVHQLIEGWKLLRPQEVITLVVSHDFEVLDVILMPDRYGEVPGGALAGPDDEATNIFAHQQALCLVSREAFVKPFRKLEVYKILGHISFLAPKLRLEPLLLVT